MGLIIKEIEIMGDKGSKLVTALFDTGVANCLIKEDVVKDVATVIKLPMAQRFRVANNQIMETRLSAVFQIGIKGYTPVITPFVLKNLPYQLIVGADFFQEWRIKLDPEREDFIIDEQRLKEGLIVVGK